MFCWESLPERYTERISQIVPALKQKEVLASFCHPKPSAIRINTLKTDMQTVRSELNKYGIETEKVTWYDDALLIPLATKKQLTDLEVYQYGHFYIQSLTSMLPALILDPKPNEIILDIASAPGGKTSQIAQMMENSGEIVANDISKKRLFKLKTVLNQQGVTNVKITQIPGEYIWKKFPNYFDKVLVDAPCSMEGRFNTQDPASFKDWSMKKIKVLSHLQKRLLRSAFYAVKPGGSVVYATCTLSPEENEEVVHRLLTEEKKHVRIETITASIPSDRPMMKWQNRLYHEGIKKTVRILPSANMEGFFVAKLKRLS